MREDQAFINRVRFHLGGEFHRCLARRDKAGRVVIEPIGALCFLAEYIGRSVAGASFRPPFVPEEGNQCGMCVEVERHPAGEVTARLFLDSPSSGAGMGEQSAIARVHSVPHDPRRPCITMDAASVPEGTARSQPVASLWHGCRGSEYPCMRMDGTAFFTIDGASSLIEADPNPSCAVHALGGCAPRAALCIARLWTCLALGRDMDVAGFDEWLRFRSLPSESRFFVRVVPRKEGGEEGACDAWVFDPEGEPVEVFRRVRFTVAEGASFASASLPDYTLPLFQRHCAALCLLELDAVAPFAWKAFSGEELTPFLSMGAPRKKSYAAARIACKILTRKLGGDFTTPADGIVTVSMDYRAPQCPVAGPGASYHCAVSHDDRFCVAVAGRRPIGVDVERISGRLLRAGRRFMIDEEKRLVSDFPLGEEEGSVRVWTVKEAAAKALAVSLPEAWKRAVVTAIGPAESLARVGDLHVVARHETLEGHVFSLLELPEPLS